MQIKELFTVPEGKQVTEKVFSRVLLSSICSILLCMACLAGTTWAWFAVSIENADNVIQIATVTKMVRIINTESNTELDPVNGGYHLENGKYKIQVLLNSDATGTDDLNKQKGPVYVLMTLACENQEVDTQYYYFTFEGDTCEAQKMWEIQNGPAAVSFSVSWVKPASAVPIEDIASAEAADKEN